MRKKKYVRRIRSVLISIIIDFYIPILITVRDGSTIDTMITSNPHSFGKIIVALLIAFLFFGCVTTKGDLFERVVASDTTDTEKSDGETGGSKKPDMGDTEPTSGETPTEAENEPITKPELKDGVSINTAPEGASVYVDGDYAGRTPILLDVDEGNYDIAIRMIGYYPEIYEITYVEGEYQVIDVTLTEITGYLYITAEPSDAEITIGGSSVKICKAIVVLFVMALPSASIVTLLLTNPNSSQHVETGRDGWIANCRGTPPARPGRQMIVT